LPGECGCLQAILAERLTRARDKQVGPAGNAGVCDASDRTVEKLSKTVLTVLGGAAYKPAIETAPPLSGASSALH